VLGALAPLAGFDLSTLAGFQVSTEALAKGGLLAGPRESGPSSATTAAVGPTIATYSRRRFMETYKYPVLVTINGITLAFNGPDLDPVAVDHKAHGKDRKGALEEYFLWKDGDNPTTHRVMFVNVSGYVIHVETWPNAQDWWHYKIWTDMVPIQFKRKHKGGQWEALEPVSKLRIEIEGENDPAAIDSASTHIHIARIEHQGSNCTVTWNPATRQYQRTCQG
jgi:hypothetical protein